MPQGKPLTVPDDGLTTAQRRHQHGQADAAVVKAAEVGNEQRLLERHLLGSAARGAAHAHRLLHVLTRVRGATTRAARATTLIERHLLAEHVLARRIRGPQRK